MKKTLTILSFLCTVTFFAQNNTFPTSGNVGIGTINPTFKLHLHENSTTAVRLHLTNNETGINWSDGLQIIQNGTSLNYKANFLLRENGQMGFWTNNIERLTIDNMGNIGVGSKNPDEKLTVKGKIHAEEVRVDLNVPADYVFQKYYTGFSALKTTYKMPTLEEVAIFTKKHHHLPEMPSAKEIQKEGLHLKQMTNLLLQKVEELTLYTINQEKRIKALEKKLAAKKK